MINYVFQTIIFLWLFWLFDTKSVWIEDKSCDFLYKSFSMGWKVIKKHYFCKCFFDECSYTGWFTRNVIYRVIQEECSYTGWFRRNVHIQGDSGGMFIYRVIQEESAILWEMRVCVILSKKSSYEHGSDFERLPRYGKKKIRTILRARTAIT